MHLRTLITSLLNSGWILLEEVTCESLLGFQGLRRVIIEHYIDWFELWILKGTHMFTLYKCVKCPSLRRGCQLFFEMMRNSSFHIKKLHS